MSTTDTDEDAAARRELALLAAETCTEAELAAQHADVESRLALERRELHARCSDPSPLLLRLVRECDELTARLRAVQGRPQLNEHGLEVPGTGGRARVARWRPARNPQSNLVHYVDPLAAGSVCGDITAHLTPTDLAVGCERCRAERKRLAPRGGWPGPARASMSARFTDAQFAALDTLVAAGYGGGRNDVLARLIDEHAGEHVEQGQR